LYIGYKDFYLPVHGKKLDCKISGNLQNIKLDDSGRK